MDTKLVAWVTTAMLKQVSTTSTQSHLVLSAGKVSQLLLIALQDISACSPTSKVGSNAHQAITRNHTVLSVSLAPSTINV
jgi:hypothetical protein